MILEMTPEYLKTLPKKPHSYEELRADYGNPAVYASTKALWEKSVLRTLPLPFVLPWAYDNTIGVARVRGHVLIVEHLVATLRLCVEEMKVPISQLVYGGCYQWRSKRSDASQLSIHTWGLAVDIDPANNPMGKRWEIGMLDARIIEAFEMAGWQWGGRWKKPDGMHFQYAVGI